MKKKIYIYILLIFLVPSIGMLFYSGAYVSQKYNTLIKVDEIKKAITYVQHSELLLNSLQRERGISCIYISSLGSTFKNRLELQRESTNLAYSKFKTLIKIKNITNKKHQENISNIKLKFNQITKLRDKVDNLQFKNKDSFNEYTKINNLLINSISYTLTFNNSTNLSNTLSSLINIIKTKEHAGVERALLSNIFTKGCFSTKGIYEDVIKVISMQNVNINEFLLNSNTKELTIYNNNLTSSINSKIESYRNKIIDSHRKATGSFDSNNAMQWWNISTNRVDAFGKVANNITTNILNQLLTIEKKAKAALIFSLLFWIIGFFALLIALFYLRELMKFGKQNYIQILKQKYINSILIQTNELIIYDHTQEQLFNEICEVSVKGSHLSLAFIGLLDKDGSINIVSSAGSAIDYLSKLLLTTNPDDKNKHFGLAGKAIIADKNIIIDNILQDGSSLMFDVANKNNLHSAAAYPIRKFNKIVGVIVLYAKDINFFAKDIISIIDKMVNNISFALEKIDHEHKRQEEEAQLVYKAQHDSLTNLPNRFLFMERLDYSIKAKSRTTIKGAVIFIDLDNFKPVNDNFGHHVGDLLLIKVANILKDSIREEDTVARLGGDEFVVLIDHLDNSDKNISKNKLVSISNKIRVAIEQTHILDNEEINISASIGVVMFPEEFKNKEEIIKASDQAMYDSKKSGKNKVIFYN